MTRTYDVTSMEVLPKLDDYSDVVIKLDFTYGDVNASLKGSCSLPAPEDTLVPLESVSKELALEWLLANCPNTTEEFDAQLDRELAEKANEPFVYDWAEPAPEEEPEA
jgi:hypothetical protein